MTPTQQRALRDFAHAVGSFADLMRFHMKRTLPEADYEARGEVDGAYQDLIDVRDRLINTLR